MRLKLKRRALMEAPWSPQTEPSPCGPKTRLSPFAWFSGIEPSSLYCRSGRPDFYEGETQAPVGRGPHAAEGSENRRQTQLGLRVRF